MRAVGAFSKGKLAEHALIVRLLELGHKVAVPVVDDDGVDLVVNYSMLVQVKASSQRLAGGGLNVPLHCVGRHAKETKQYGRGRRHIAAHVGILAVYALDSSAWWLIPREQVGSRTTLRLAEYDRTQGLSAWRDAWWVFDS